MAIMAILLGFVFCVLTFLAPSEAFRKNHNHELRNASSTCNENVTAICIDCYTLGLCAGGTPTPATCSVGQACLEIPANGTIEAYAQCDAQAMVPACTCPPSGFTQMADAYDNQKYLVCVNGEGTIQSCGDSLYYDPNLKQCVNSPPTTTTPSTTTTTTPGPQCVYNSSGNVQLEEESCFSAKMCMQDNTLSDGVACPVNTVLNNATLTCLPYLPFSCLDYPTIVGLLGDPNNCPVFHFCVSGVEQTPASFCPAGEYFDNTTQICSTSAGCNFPQHCLCTNSAVIPYDCTRFYVCDAVSAGFYEPELQSCPEGFYIDPNTLMCVLVVPGCP